MNRNILVNLGEQRFDRLREEKKLYIDKTDFIREWWENSSIVTLITRPRRFGKTLNMSMLECFFSNRFEGRSDLFEGLSIWEKEEYRKLQGTYPVISLSFAGIKENMYSKTYEHICQVLSKLFNRFDYIKISKKLTEGERGFFEQIESGSIRETEAAVALHNLSDYLSRYYGNAAHESECSCRQYLFQFRSREHD